MQIVTSGPDTMASRSSCQSVSRHDLATGQDGLGDPLSALGANKAQSSPQVSDLRLPHIGISDPSQETVRIVKALPSVDFTAAI